MAKRRGIRIALLASATWLVASTTQAESGLILAYPKVFGQIPAATYDDSGRRLGSANMLIEKLDGGRVMMRSKSGIEGGARTIASIELAPIEQGSGLRPLVQESRSFDSSGAALGVLRIDHTHAVATCTPPDGGPVDSLALPLVDHVANVPFNLLFLPLVSGAVDSVNFQFVLCNGGARTMDFEAHVAGRGRESRGLKQWVEVRYGPRFGAVVSFLAQAVVPKLSFWFDPDSLDPWLGHRLPLYAKGPEVLVIRDGVSTDSFVGE